MNKYSGRKKKMKKSIKIFGIVVAFLIISLSITPIYGSHKINEILENHQKIVDGYQQKILENKPTEKTESQEQTSNSDEPGNSGYTKYQQRMGWKYDKKIYRRDMAISFFRIGIVGLITVGVPIGTILAIFAFIEMCDDDETDPYDLYLLAAEILGLVLAILAIVEGRPIAKRVQEFYDSVDAFFGWLGEEHWKTDMIIYGWVLRCKPSEEITVYCRGEDETYTADIFGRAEYRMIVSCTYGGDKPENIHICEITIEGDKHDRTLKSKVGDEWCYSDGMLRNWLNWIV